MIILRTPKGWTGRPKVDGVRSPEPGAPTRCRWPAWDNPDHLSAAGEAGLSSYRPEELFDADGSPIELVARRQSVGCPENERHAACQRRAADPRPRPA